MNNKETNLKRRSFLLAAGVGSAGAVAVVATAVTAKEVAKPVVVSAEEKSGSYEQTAHVSNYYRTARV